MTSAYSTGIDGGLITLKLTILHVTHVLEFSICFLSHYLILSSPRQKQKQKKLLLFSFDRGQS